MKKNIKLFMSLIILFLLVGRQDLVEAKAGPKFLVKLVKCIDGDTAQFTKVGTTRFLYVDTPEKNTKYGKLSANYTCTILKKAKRIELQYDGIKKDKYKRTLAWVWVDGKFHQLNLVKKGYVLKFYDYGTYSYESILQAAQRTAKKNKVGIWSKQPSTSSIPTYFKNCTELRKYYPNGVKKGHKAYRKALDRDNDGVACEKY